MWQQEWSPALRLGAPALRLGAEAVAAEVVSAEPKRKKKKAMEEKKEPGLLEKFFSKKRAPEDAPEGPELPAPAAARTEAPDTPGAEGSVMPLEAQCCRCDTQVSVKEATKKSRLTWVCHKCSRLGSRLN